MVSGPQIMLLFWLFPGHDGLPSSVMVSSVSKETFPGQLTSPPADSGRDTKPFCIRSMVRLTAERGRAATSLAHPSAFPGWSFLFFRF